MSAILRCLSGVYAGNQLEVGSQPIIIGRDPAQANLVIPENQTEISGRHVSVWFDDVRQTFMLLDTSTNGTYLMSGERIARDRPYPIYPGTRFYLCNTNTSFEVDMTERIPFSPGSIHDQMGYGGQSIQTPPPGYGQTRGHAGFWKRFIAFVIDGVVTAIVSVLLIIVLAVPVSFSMPPDEEAIFGAYMILGASLSLITWLYYSLMESSKYQGTLGKMALGIKVTDIYGRPVSFGRATGRYFGKIITSLIPLGIGYMLAGWTERKQAVHDMIAGCLVENK